MSFLQKLKALDQSKLSAPTKQKIQEAITQFSGNSAPLPVEERASARVYEAALTEIERVEQKEAQDEQNRIKAEKEKQEKLEREMEERAAAKIQAENERKQKEAEDARIEAEKLAEAEKKKLEEEQNAEAENARIAAEKEAEDARVAAEKEAEDARIAAEKAAIVDVEWPHVIAFQNYPAPVPAFIRSKKTGTDLLISKWKKDPTNEKKKETAMNTSIATMRFINAEMEKASSSKKPTPSAPVNDDAKKKEAEEARKLLSQKAIEERKLANDKMLAERKQKDEARQRQLELNEKQKKEEEEKKVKEAAEKKQKDEEEQKRIAAEKASNDEKEANGFTGNPIFKNMFGV